jgi:acetyl-CoA carboxylase carboxyltransferase component
MDLKFSKFSGHKNICKRGENSMLSDTKAGGILLRLFDGESREIGGAVSSVTCASGEVRGTAVFAFAQDRERDGGIMTRAGADKIIKTMRKAAECGAPVVGIFDSDGASLCEGAAAMAYYGDILAAAADISGVVPFFAVSDGVCSASSALIAAAADFFIATENAEVYLTPGKNADDSLQIAAIKVPDLEAALKTAADLIEIFPQNNLGRLPDFEFEAPAFDKSDLAASVLDAGTPTFELFGGYGSAKTLIGTIGGEIAGVVNIGKDKLACRDCQKIARFISLLDAYSIPAVTLADGGFADDICARAIVTLARAYAEATNVKITVAVGGLHGAFGSVLLSGNADAVFALPNAAISPLSPETAVEFFMHDKLKGAANLAEKRKELAAGYAKDEASPEAAAKAGVIEAVTAPENLRGEIAFLLDILRTKRAHARPAKKHSV